MSDRPAGLHTGPGQYEIRLKGRLGSRWAAWFDGLSITHGCVRLGDRDLETIYKGVRIGTPVYIY